MSFKTSVLIWFSRSRGTASPPSPSPTERGCLTGVGLLCKTEESIGFGDIVTNEHRVIVTY